MEHGNFGRKTFIFFILRRSGFAFLCIFIFLGLFFVTDIIPGFIQAYLQFIDFFLVILILFSIGGTIGIAYLEYRNFTIFIHDRNMKITSGIINRHEVGIPYKAIDRVDIIRTLACQLFGVSNIVIHITNDNNPGTNDEIVTLSFIEKDLAENIQHEILEHAQVEHIKDIGDPQQKI